MSPDDGEKRGKAAAAGHAIATPERELEELRKRQKADRKKVSKVEARMKAREKKIAETKEEAQLVARLERAGVKAPFRVILAADRASDAVDVPEDEFRAMALVILRKETGIPQRAVFGCDHGPQGGTVPYCGDLVTSARGRELLRALHSDVWANMNGVHWTQTTWYEKVYRVEKLSADLTDPEAHMKVCFGDLAILRDAYGVAEAFRRYNGAGPAAEAYKAAAMGLLPWAKKLITG